MSNGIGLIFSASTAAKGMCNHIARDIIFTSQTPSKVQDVCYQRSELLEAEQAQTGIHTYIVYTSFLLEPYYEDVSII